MTSIDSNKYNKRVAGAGRLLACALALALAGCGGGGSDTPGATPAIGSLGPDGSSSGNPATPAALSVTLALTGTDAAAAASTTLALGKPLLATVTVRDKLGQPAANALLTFSVDPVLVSMTPATVQIATDSTGKASVTLSPAGITGSGATLVTALAEYGGETATGQALITVAAPKLTFTQVAPVATPAPLAAYAAALVTLDLYNDGVLLSSLPVTVNLASVCGTAGRATLPASVTTVQGRAQFTYQDKGCAQSDSIDASIDGSSAAASVKLTVASPVATSIEVGDIVPADASIVIQGAGGNGRTETASVRFHVRDKNGVAVVNQNVTFATVSTKTVRLAQASSVTDANGDVFASLISGTEPTAVRVVATLDNGLSTVSDTITVTTGLPVQLAFSLSAQSYNIEGFDVDDVTDEIKVLLADQFSNPVADGVAVVLQTDSGAIGTSARGGCVTVNGRCTVDLRSQNPRYGTDAGAPQKRAGLATITATALATSDVPLTGQLAVFLSGSKVSTVSLVNAPAGVTLVNGTITATTTGCAAVNFSVRLSDARRNPMPAGSSLSFDSAVLLAGNAYPTSVASVAPVLTNGVVTGDQGSVHTLALLPDPATCLAGGTKSATGSANLVLTTPNGTASLVPVTLRFPVL
jgi:hypothetical protein